MTGAAASGGEPLIVFALGGQGSQYYQMGRELFEADPEFRQLMLERDDVIRRAVGRSVLAEIYGPKSKHTPFRDINYTHLALLLFQCALAARVRLWGIVPDRLLGCSAGELCAAVVAGAIEFEAAVHLVEEQARALQRLCQRAYMIAVLANEARVLDAAGRTSTLWIASRTGAENVTITGPLRDRERVLAALAHADLPSAELAVEYGFHSPLIDPMEESVRRHCRAIPWRAAAVPVLSCATGGALVALGEQSVWDAVRQPVEVRRTLVALERTAGRRVYYDVSPSGGLAALLSRELLRDSRSRAVAMASPFAATRFVEQTRERSIAALAG